MQVLVFFKKNLLYYSIEGRRNPLRMLSNAMDFRSLKSGGNSSNSSSSSSSGTQTATPNKSQEGDEAGKKINTVSLTKKEYF